ncbi:MAG TPA: hypothetical protein DEG13_03695, partial [Candidatus Microthrix parvicella]|nr:hypothetical protein [Candidatus Microthrix parvicella]
PSGETGPTGPTGDLDPSGPTGSTGPGALPDIADQTDENGNGVPDAVEAYVLANGADFVQCTNFGPITVGGSGPFVIDDQFANGTIAQVFLFSTPVKVYQGTVSSDRVVTVTVPSTVEPGKHAAVQYGLNAAGETVSVGCNADVTSDSDADGPDSGPDSKPDTPVTTSPGANPGGVTVPGGTKPGGTKAGGTAPNTVASARTGTATVAGVNQSPASGPLARTGANTGVFFLVALLSIGLGGTILVLGRRRSVRN